MKECSLEEKPEGWGHSEEFISAFRAISFIISLSLSLSLSLSEALILIMDYAEQAYGTQSMLEPVFRKNSTEVTGPVFLDI